MFNYQYMIPLLVNIELNLPVNSNTSFTVFICMKASSLLHASIGIGARSFNVNRSSHGTADIDTYYQHSNIEIT